MIGTLIRCAALLSVSIYAPLASAETNLPALPAAVQSSGVLRVGVRCDQPPYGFKDEKGNFAGIEIRMAEQLAKWSLGSGDKAELTCVTAENRIPLLIGKKVDILIATLGITPERERVIDFSHSYRWGGSDVVVINDSPIKKLQDLQNKTVIVLKGSTQAKWFEENMPSATTLRLNTVSDGIQAIKQGRADGFSLDVASLVVVDAKDPEIRALGDVFLISSGGVGIRKNDREMVDYVNAALDKMKAEGLYIKWVDEVVPEGVRQYYVDVLTKEKPTSVIDEEYNLKTKQP